ncbi:MAG: DUF3606 domain-containing protein [Dokdonella sp.]
MNPKVDPLKGVPSKETRRPTTVAIDLDDSTQATWWAMHFGVTRAELLLAILRAGRDAESVRKALGK